MQLAVMTDDLIRSFSGWFWRVVVVVRLSVCQVYIKLLRDRNELQLSAVLMAVVALDWVSVITEEEREREGEYHFV